MLVRNIQNKLKIIATEIGCLTIDISILWYIKNLTSRRINKNANKGSVNTDKSNVNCGKKCDSDIDKGVKKAIKKNNLS
jgi:hypothetical protein